MWSTPGPHTQRQEISMKSVCGPHGPHGPLSFRYVRAHFSLPHTMPVCTQRAGAHTWKNDADHADHADQASNGAALRAYPYADHMRTKPPWRRTNAPICTKKGHSFPSRSRSGTCQTDIGTHNRSEKMRRASSMAGKKNCLGRLQSSPRGRPVFTPKACSSRDISVT